MPAPGEVVGLAHEAVGTPRHHVRESGRDLEGAPGADVGLHSRAGAVRLHVPDAVALRLGAEAPEQGAFEIDRLALVTTTVGAGHVSSLGPFDRLRTALDRLD